MVLEQPVLGADLAGGDVDAVLVAVDRPDGNRAGSLGADVDLVRDSGRPPDQFLLPEDRHDRQHVGVVDVADLGVVVAEDVARPDARVVLVAGPDHVLDRVRRGVDVHDDAARERDRVALGRVEHERELADLLDDRARGDVHRRLARGDEAAAEAREDLLVTDRGAALEVEGLQAPVVTGLGEQAVLLVQHLLERLAVPAERPRGRRLERPACVGDRHVVRPPRSRDGRSVLVEPRSAPGGIASVSAGDSTIAGPAITFPARRSDCSKIGVSTHSACHQTGRVAFAAGGCVVAQRLDRERRLLDLHGARHDGVRDQVAELGRLGRARVHLPVGVLEGLDQPVDVGRGLEALRRRIDLDVVQLPVVLHPHEAAERDLVLGLARLRELGGHLLPERVPRLLDRRGRALLRLRRRTRRDRQVDREVVAILEVGAGAAEGREAGRPRRHQHVAIGDPVRVAGDVQRAAASVAEAGRSRPASSPCRAPARPPHTGASRRTARGFRRRHLPPTAPAAERSAPRSRPARAPRPASGRPRGSTRDSGGRGPG